MSTKTLKIPKTLHRAGSFTMCPETKTMRLSISSNEPYKRYDYRNDEEYWEELDHTPSGVDISRLKNGAALLYNHDRNIMLGTLSNPTLENGRCYVEAKMSNAPDVESYRIKVEEGILKDTSIGYTLCDEGKKVGERDGCPVYRFRFAVHEASLVTIPADPSVGLGRQRDAETTEFQEIAVDVKNTVDDTNNQNHNHSNQTKTMAEPTAPTAPTIDVTKERTDAVQAERKRVSDIQELQKHFLEKGIAGRRVDTSNLAQQMIRDGKTVDDFQTLVIRTELPEVKEVSTTPELGLSEKEKKSFSFCRALLSLKRHGGLDGLEKEASEAHAKQIGKPVEGLGFYIPEDIMRGRAFPNGISQEQQRALFSNVYSGAGAFVGTDLLGGSLIDLLRNQMFVVAMGARSLGGLNGNVAIPRQTGGATASWLAEDSTASNSQQTVGQLNLTPHKLMATTAYTEQLLMQSSVDVENFVRQDLMAVIAIARDLAALHGTGVSGQPVGITATTGVPTVAIAGANSMTYIQAVGFETTVANANALSGKLGWLATPTTRGNGRVLQRFSNTNTPVWTDENTVLGYPAKATLQVASPGVIFGNWEDLILAEWADTSVLVDPYSLSLQSQVRVIMRMYCDNGVRHTGSFAYGAL